ncbi:hypothetical protein EVAR_7375_1 [Eumeta japonica]|uniref:Uncharacterized protein n=1 Tax=Eumeta variegata TaxID=151549 RepID=A0A4C1V8I3_EUMVA|nr:hypothetical protein EVAR_7375_1 [Eumeta japonica]
MLDVGCGLEAEVENGPPQPSAGSSTPDEIGPAPHKCLLRLFHNLRAASNSVTRVPLATTMSGTTGHDDVGYHWPRRCRVARWSCEEREGTGRRRGEGCATQTSSRFRT